VLAVAGLLLLGLTEGTRLGLAIFYRQTELSERRASLDAVYRVLRDLIAHARPGSEWEDLVFLGTPHSAEFTSVLPLPTAGSPTRRADVELVVDPAQRLSLVWTPHWHAIRTGRTPPPTAVPLLEGVARLDLGYWPAKGGGWTTAWRGSAPPRLVRIRIVFSTGDRGWPDLVAAPMLDPL
jgi:general secretion pathway protein J